jgi:hypothetical protein
MSATPLWTRSVDLPSGALRIDVLGDGELPVIALTSSEFTLRIPLLSSVNVGVVLGEAVQFAAVHMQQRLRPARRSDN